MPLQINFELLFAIKRKGLTQLKFAELVGDHFTFVSRVINGWQNLDEKRKVKYAQVLGQKVEHLFGK